VERRIKLSLQAGTLHANIVVSPPFPEPGDKFFQSLSPTLDD